MHKAIQCNGDMIAYSAFNQVVRDVLFVYEKAKAANGRPLFGRFIQSIVQPINRMPHASHPHLLANPCMYRLLG